MSQGQNTTPPPKLATDQPTVDRGCWDAAEWGHVDPASLPPNEAAAVEAIRQRGGAGTVPYGQKSQG